MCLVLIHHYFHFALCRSVSEHQAKSSVLSLCTGSGTDIVASLLEGFSSCGLDSSSMMAVPVSDRLTQVHRACKGKPWSDEWTAMFNEERKQVVLARRALLLSEPSTPALVGYPSDQDMQLILSSPAAVPVEEADWESDIVVPGDGSQVASTSGLATSASPGAGAAATAPPPSDADLWTMFRSRPEFKTWVEDTAETIIHADAQFVAFKMARQVFLSYSTTAQHRDRLRELPSKRETTEIVSAIISQVFNARDGNGITEMSIRKCISEDEELAEAAAGGDNDGVHVMVQHSGAEAIRQEYDIFNA